jgi:hypothetical protein
MAVRVVMVVAVLVAVLVVADLIKKHFNFCGYGLFSWFLT